VEAQVLELRRLWREDRLPQGELARRFGIHKTKVNEIIHYRRWRYLP
jgi:plasmid maintenance system antidote protein VapI